MNLSPEDIQHNWSTLLHMCSNRDPDLAKVLVCYAADLVDDDGTRVLGLRTAPAGKSMHHAYEGGLVKHMLEMVNYIDVFAQQWPKLCARSLFAGVVAHDLHKGCCHYKCTDHGIDYYDHYYTKSMTPNQKTMAMLCGSIPIVPNAPIYRPTPQLLNIINCSEGGWAENAPREASIEAKLVYIADELSVVESRMADGRIHSIRDRANAFFSFTPMATTYNKVL